MRYTPEERLAMHEEAKRLDEEGNILLQMAFRIRMEVNKYDHEPQAVNNFESSEHYYTHPDSNGFISWD